MSGRAELSESLVVRSIIAVLVVAALPLIGGAATAQEGTGYTRVVDIAFPVSGDVWYQRDYHSWRGGGTRRHQANDVFGDKLQPLHAAVDGRVCRMTGVEEPMPSWGYSITLCGDDGLEYRYLHANNDSPGTDDGLGGPGLAYAPGLEVGDRVDRGQWIAYMGDSGNAEETDVHLHFEIHDADLVDPALAEAPYKQGRIDPFYALESARRRGDRPSEPATVPPATSPAPAPSDPPIAPPGEPLVRLAGQDRVGTALRLSGQRGSAHTVVVVPAGSHAEALVAAPLAGLVESPVLLSGPDGLEPRVAAEVRRLGARNAYVIGRTDQLSARVEADLRAAGVQGQARMSEPDVFALSATVAREMASFPSTGGRFERVFLALGAADDPSRAWPDALSASAPAARLRVPVLLTRTDALPAEVAEILRALAPGRVDVVGGEVAVSGEVASAAASAAGGDVSRLAGEDRYATSVAVAVLGRDIGLDGDGVFAATGRNFPDALAAGPAAARTRAPVLLVDGDDPDGSPASMAWLADAGVTEVVVVGGPAAVTDPVADALEALVRR